MSENEMKSEQLKRQLLITEALEQLQSEEIAKNTVMPQDIPDDEVFVRKLTGVVDAHFKKTVRRRKRRRVAKVAALILAPFLVCGVMIVSVKAWRVSLLNVVYKIGDKFTSVTMDDDNASNVVIPESIPVPAYIPQGYKCMDANNFDENGFIVLYANDTSTIHYSVFSDNANLGLDSENADVNVIKIGGRDAFLLEKDGYVSLQFIAQNKCCILSGTIERDEIIKMAQSVEMQ